MLPGVVIIDHGNYDLQGFPVLHQFLKNGCKILKSLENAGKTALKMALKNPTVRPQSMVLSILYANAGQGFSVSDLQIQVSLNFCFVLKKNTIYEALRELIAAMPDHIESFTRRVGPKRGPAVFYSFSKNSKNHVRF